MTAYQPLTSVEQDAHLTMASVVGRTGIYASGEAHFFDSIIQNATDSGPASGTSIFEFNQLSTQFSNATTEYFIDDFTIFNIYRHNTNLYTVNTSSLLNIAVNRFNLYSVSFRNGQQIYNSSLTSTTTTPSPFTVR